MAIPATPSGFYAQTANIQNYVSWDITVGATSYNVQRSADGVIYASVSTPSVTEYLDTSVTAGTQYWYKVASVNSDGTSSYTTPQSLVPTAVGEMSLGFLRLSAQQSADKVNSDFVTLPEWNSFINLAMNELYDLLVTSYEDYFMANPISFTTNGSDSLYALPSGSNTFTSAAGAAVTPPAFYKLLGLDLGVNSAFVTLKKFQFTDRNKYAYPNPSPTGVYDMEYRVMGTNINFIPTPSSGQTIRIWYIPRLTQLLKDRDITTIGYSGWLRYVIVRAAKYALDKEESETSKQDAELLFLKNRIEETAANRDVGEPSTISDTRGSNSWGGIGDGCGGWR